VDERARPDDPTTTTQEVTVSLPRGTTPTEAWVEVLDGPDAGVVARLGRRLFRIGLDPLSDLVLKDPTISRRHCEIRFVEDGFLLEDLGSTNGTFVDELKLGQIFLENGVLIRVGNTLLRFHTQADEPQLESRFDSLTQTLVGVSPAIREIFEQVLKVAPTDLSVVLEGETGTGKELVARAIHKHSLRLERPFVVFDCSSFPPTLIESELFGHEKGAFTGSAGVHKGVFERANTGTLFMDELGEMDVGFQAKFLRSLESGEIRRVGGERTFHVDVRIIAATNRSLEALISEGRFREDLFYRLAKVRLTLPRLRDRVEDIPLLINHFMDLTVSSDTPRPTVTPEAMEVLCSYAWPGNIRELRNIVERAAALCEGGRITGDFIRGELGSARRHSVRTPWSQPVISETYADLLPGSSDETVSLRDAKEQIIADFERRYIMRLLEKHPQNISHAAREAKVDRRHFYRLLKKHGLMDWKPE
jgi:DNA-binding NtrC family response regulator